MKDKNQSRCIVFVAQSLDGFIADETGGLEWLEMIPNPEGQLMGYDKLMEDIDAIVLGRNTFETVLGFEGEWPYSKPVFVLSRSLTTVPLDLQKKVSILRGDPESIVQKIRSQGYRNLYIDGGRTVQDFLRDDLIDEIRLTTLPILLGKGIPLFGVLQHKLEFRLSSSDVFLGHLVQSIYTRHHTQE